MTRATPPGRRRLALALLLASACATQKTERSADARPPATAAEASPHDTSMPASAAAPVATPAVPPDFTDLPVLAPAAEPAPTGPMIVQHYGTNPTVDTRALSVVADAVSTAWQAMKKAHVQSGDAVLVVGAGGVGGFLSQLARAEGARVVAMDISDARLSALSATGNRLRK